jgi:hypothetical protein
MSNDKKTTGTNSTFAIGGASFSTDSFAVKRSAVLRMNICAEKTAHRKSADRYLQAYEDTTNIRHSN